MDSSDAVSEALVLLDRIAKDCVQLPGPDVPRYRSAFFQVFIPESAYRVHPSPRSLRTKSSLTSTKPCFPTFDGKTLGSLLKYGCYGYVENLKDNSKDVPVPADKYELLGRKERRKDILGVELNAENVTEMLLFADKMSAEKLQKAAIQFLAADPDSTVSAETN
ncbi:hypothetical protein RvY_11787 [Ramazzottius varieornatus]|uniref:Uncharacterized protein n=1 Tax=Ramazzottius varieornatus TaxID=947166 RepID=A0A1D1VR31_RAMVA|nr:hypothetical protein RvY_11787 [Ramazzottius varieornatus]